MPRPISRPALIALAALLITGGALLPALAHDPHETPTAGAPVTDLDAPRRPSEQTARLIGLQTAEVDFGHVESIVHLTGIVRAMPEQTHIITSAVAGNLMRLDARLGERVKRGQSLGAVQSADLARMVTDLHKAEIEYEHAGVEVATTNSNIAQLKNQINSTEAQAASLEAEYARAQAGGDAVSANVLSNRRVTAQQSRAQVDTLKISLATAERTLKALGKIQESTLKTIDSMNEAIEIIHAHPAGIDLAEEAREEGESGGRFILHAPIDGIVIRRDGVPGQGLEPGKPILTVVNDAEMLIEADLPESMISSFAADLAAGAPGNAPEVRIRRAAASASEPIAVGRVIGISPTVDPIKRTARLLVSATNTRPPDGDNHAAPDANPAAPVRVLVPATLQEGMFVTLDVVRGGNKAASESSRSVVIPISAIVSDGPAQFVFIKEKDAYVRRDIVPGPRDDRNVEITDGLVPGDIVVTQGAYLLSQLRGAPEADHHH
jgi:multidrug efflux pump subunit AcrA (membrane-fusion protein)